MEHGPFQTHSSNVLDPMEYVPFQTHSPNVSIDIFNLDAMIKKLLPLPEKCSIYRVPKRFLRINPTAYTPQVVSIGPFHCNRAQLMVTHDHKLWSLHKFRSSTHLNSDSNNKKIMSWTERAGSYYAEPISITDEFTLMLLLDGCFILDLMIRSIQSGTNRVEDELDRIFYRSLSIELYRDLTMLENQLPFFVLKELYEMYHNATKFSISFHKVIQNMFRFLHKYPVPEEILTEGILKEVTHLVHYLTFYYIPSTVEKDSTEEPNKSGELQIPPTATELHDAGVVFKAATEAKRITDIAFKNGVLEIPPFTIDHSFEIYTRNIIAFEQYEYDRNAYASQYVRFLDGLINTERDASVLVKANIISNHLGSDDNISKVLNDLCKEVSLSSDYYLSGVCNALHKHCGRRRNRWMVSLRRDYFNTPWAFISFLAAVFLIFLTLLQTVFSGLCLGK